MRTISITIPSDKEGSFLLIEDPSGIELPVGNVVEVKIPDTSILLVKSIDPLLEEHREIAQTADGIHLETNPDKSKFVSLHSVTSIHTTNSNRRAIWILYGSPRSGDMWEQFKGDKEAARRLFGLD